MSLQDAMTDLKAALLAGENEEAAVAIGADYGLAPALILRKLAESLNAPLSGLGEELRNRAAYASRIPTAAELAERADHEARERRAGERFLNQAIAEWAAKYLSGRRV